MLGKPRTNGQESLDPLAVHFSECARRIVPTADRQRALEGELGRKTGPVDGRVGGPVSPAFFTRGPIAGRVPTAERR